jgi:hypothetical protein
VRRSEISEGEPERLSREQLRGRNRCPSALVTYRSTVVIAAQVHSSVRRSIETARQSSQHSCRCAAALMRVAWHWGQLRI